MDSQKNDLNQVHQPAGDVPGADPEPVISMPPTPVSTPAPGVGNEVASATNGPSVLDDNSGSVPSDPTVVNPVVPSPAPGNLTPETPSPSPESAVVAASAPAAPAKKRSSPVVVVVLVVLVVLGLTAAAYFALLKDDGKQSSKDQSQTTASTETSTETVPEDPEAASQSIDDNLAKLDDDKDLSADDISDTALGL